MASRISPYVDNTGLVFAYDLANIKRSYLGQPTTNTVGQLNSFNPLDLYTWASSGNTSTWSRDVTAPLSPARGIPLKEISSGTDSYSNTYNNTVNNISTASSGQTWTVSVYALATAGTNIQVWIFGANSSGNYIELNVNSFTATGVWQRISVTMTFTNGSTAAVQARVATATNGGVIWWDGLQTEQKSYATQFTTGTRSVTQGLRDLTGNSTIDLTNVSFDANAQMTFDGTNDYVEMSSFNIDQNNEFTLEAIIYPNTVSGNQSIIKKNTSNDNWPIFSMTLIGSNINGYYSSPTYGQCLEGADGTSGIITANKFWHVAYSKGAGGYTTMKLYINGVSVPYSNFLYGSHINSIATSTKPIHIGRNLDGASWVQPFNGIIPVSRVYNRQLTDSEIQQNFNAIKGRYGL